MNDDAMLGPKETFATCVECEHEEDVNTAEKDDDGWPICSRCGGHLTWSDPEPEADAATVLVAGGSR